MTQDAGNGGGAAQREQITLGVFSDATVNRGPGNLVQLGIQLAFQNGADAILIVRAGHRVEEFYAPPPGKHVNIMAAGSNVRLTNYADGTTEVADEEVSDQ